MFQKLQLPWTETLNVVCVTFLLQQVSSSLSLLRNSSPDMNSRPVYRTQPSNFVWSQTNPLHILRPSILCSVSIPTYALCPGIQMGFFLQDLKILYHFSINQLHTISSSSLIFLELLTPVLFCETYKPYCTSSASFLSTSASLTPLFEKVFHTHTLRKFDVLWQAWIFFKSGLT